MKNQSKDLQPDKILLFKRIAAYHLLSLHKEFDLAYKLFVLQVYCGVKRAGTFDGFVKSLKTTKEVLSLLNSLKIYYRLLDLGANTKVIFSRNKTDVSKLYRLHEAVFNNGSFSDQYGALLGYPKCCVAKFMLKTPARLLAFPSCSIGKVTRDGKYKLSFKLNRLSLFPLVHHVPCKTNCEETLRLADKTLDLYRAYNPGLAQWIIVSYKKPVLVFGENNYVRFSGECREDTIDYSSLWHVNPSRLESGRINKEDARTIKIVKFLEKGDRIVFKSDVFKVFKNSRLIFENHSSSQKFQVMDFK